MGLVGTQPDIFDQLNKCLSIESGRHPFEIQQPHSVELIVLIVKTIHRNNHRSISEPLRC